MIENILLTVLLAQASPPHVAPPQAHPVQDDPPLEITIANNPLAMELAKNMPASPPPRREPAHPIVIPPDPIPWKVEYPMPGHFQERLTYVVWKEAYQRLKASLGLDHARAVALEEAYAHYRTAVEVLPGKLADAQGTPERPFEGLTSVERVRQPEVQERYLQARDRSHRNADRAMVEAFRAFEQAASDLLQTDNERATWRSWKLRWRREALMDYRYYCYPAQNDLTQDVDLTHVARVLCHDCPGLCRWFSETSDSGAAVPAEDAAPEAQHQRGVAAAMDAYVNELDACVQAQWDARAPMYSAALACERGFRQPLEREEAKAERRWLEVFRLAERTRDAVAAAIEGGGDPESALAWRRAVDAAYFAKLYAVDRMDVAYAWLLSRDDLSEAARERIACAYEAAVKERQEVCKMLEREMVAAIDDGSFPHREVEHARVYGLPIFDPTLGYAVESKAVPRFKEPMARRRAVGERAIAAWKEALDAHQADDLDAAMGKLRRSLINGISVDF